MLFHHKMCVKMFLFIFVLTCLDQIQLSSSKKLPTARIINFKGKPISRTSVLLQWNTSRPLLPDSSFMIRYGFDGNTDITEIPTNSEALNYTISELEFHSYYRFQVAPKEQGKTGRFSTSRRVALDISTFILKVQLPSETRPTFQNALHDVLPLSFLTSDLLNSSRIDLDTSMVEAFYEIFFNIGVNITDKQLTGMFSRNFARSHTSYVRNIKVLPSLYCNTERHECHRLAQCTDRFGTYSCKCRSDFVDLNSRSHEFPGRNCSQNTAKPGEMALTVINTTAVHVKFRAPRQRLGSISYYEVQYSTVSGDPPTPLQELHLERYGAYLEKTVIGLAPNNLHRFRARAITSIAPGKWNDWKQVRTVVSLFQINFDLRLKRAMKNYPAKQTQIHKEISNQVEDALRVSRTVSMTDVQVLRSELFSNNTIRFYSVLYTKQMRRVDLNRIKNAALFRLKGRFTYRLGTIDPDSLVFEDFDECANNYADCAGNSCTNEVGSYSCQCEGGLVDIGSDFDLFAGRKCIDLRVDLPQENFTKDNYIVSKVVDELRMTSVYEFRVAIANIDSNGRFTVWKSIETSNLIFNAKLNLTLLVYSPNFQKKNHALASKTAKRVRTVVNSVLNRMPQYTATGNVVFSPGIKDRTYAYAYLFFNNRGNTKARQIQESFKHNSVFDSVLGIDFDTVNVTDFNECNSTWNDCGAHAQCINKSPGFSCVCEEEYVDFSADDNRKPGRVCIHPNDITTAPPTTTAEETTAELTTVALSYPRVVLSGNAVSPTKIRLTWQRQIRRNEVDISNINYIIRYGVKGLPQRNEVSVAAETLSVDISNLHRGVIYQIQVAEKRKQSFRRYTYFTVPIQVRTNPKAFRVFVQLPDIPASSSITSFDADPQKDRLITFMSDYFSELFNHPDVKNQYKDIFFGSVGNIAFSTHPDRGVIASAVLYIVQKSATSRAKMGEAYSVGEKLVPKPITIMYMYIGDLDECSSDALNDCSPTSRCDNTVGSYRCICDSGLTDMGPTYFLLPGRLCLSPHTSTTTKGVSTTTTRAVVNNNPVTLMMSTTATASTTSASTTTKPSVVKLKPANLVGLSSGDCAKGQKMLLYACQDVDVYLGRIYVLEESGNNLTASNLLGEGKKSLTEAVETALDTAFSDMEKMTGFYQSRVQNMTYVNEKIQALFVIIMNSQSLRYRRQINFILDDFEINADFIEKAFWGYLNEKFPVGNVNPSAGASVVFGINDIVISDIDECSFRSLYDCDVNHAKCINTMGSFTCECNAGTSDVSSDVSSRPGRLCRDQCNPSPCLNGAECIALSQVGQPSCQCAEGYEGDLCGKVVEAEDNLIVIALASVAGVLFLFLVCFVVTYRVHRKNKRKEKMKISVKNFQQTSSQEVGQNHAYLSTDDNLTNSNGGLDGTEVATDVVAAAGEDVNAANQVVASCSSEIPAALPPPISPIPAPLSAPPIPARTTSIQSDGVQSNISHRANGNRSPTASYSPKEVNLSSPEMSNISQSPNPLIRPPLSKRPSSPPPRQPQHSNGSAPKLLIHISPPTSPTTKVPGNFPPDLSKENDSSLPDTKSKSRKKKSKKTKNLGKSTAIRGRIRRHSDDST